MSKSLLSLSALLAIALGAPLLLGFVSGCDRDKPPRPPFQKEARPTLRIYALAGAAGAIEPCGCVKDMLGGVDHVAAWIASQEKKAPESIVLGAGPMFFSDPSFGETGQEQNIFKAEAMAASLKDLKMVAWAPGANDWAFGAARFSELSKLSGARSLAANLPPEAGPVSPSAIVVSGGIKVGLTGVSLPIFQNGKVAFKIGDAKQALKKAQVELKNQGAEILVALVAAQRGEALRLIEATPGFHLGIIGKAFDQGDSNDDPFSPELIGGTLVTQATNHLQGVSVIDLYVRDGKFEFADGTGLEVLSRRRSLSNQIDALRLRISKIKASKTGKRADIVAQEARLKELEKELKTLTPPKAPSDKSHFLYDLVEVRESAGSHEGVASRLSAYYRRVNDHNKVTFKDKTPRPVSDGEASYVGVEICSNCHLEERAVWDKTRHSLAYGTLESGDKEFNLDCVSCHVTGYEKPGGSTVTHVDKLKSVQCETCHGPGSQHAENPADKSLITVMPDRGLCASSCHHPPHVGEDWSVDDAWPKILGKGHGLP